MASAWWIISLSALTVPTTKRRPSKISEMVSTYRTLLRMGRYEQACHVYRGDLARALLINVEAYAEVLSLLRPFFPQGWASLPDAVDHRSRSYLANDAAIALESTDERKEALVARSAVALFQSQCGRGCNGGWMTSNRIIVQQAPSSFEAPVELGSWPPRGT